MFTKIGVGIAQALEEMGADSEKARINMRAEQVRSRYKQAIETVYRNTAPLFLSHTNNVYIMNKDGVRTLIVYVDESIFSAELNAQRELIKLKLLELFGEEIEEFEIYVSRGHYKDNHPYLSEISQESNTDSPTIPLDSNEKSFVSNTTSLIENERVRKAMEKAMTADLESKKGKSVKLSSETRKPLS